MTMWEVLSVAYITEIIEINRIMEKEISPRSVTNHLRRMAIMCMVLQE